MQRALHVLVACIFRQVDAYAQPQGSDDYVIADYRSQLKDAFEKLHMHVRRIHNSYRTVRNLILWSCNKNLRSLQILLWLYNLEI